MANATDCVSEIIPAKLPNLTYRESKVVRSIVSGLSEYRAILSAGLPEFYAHHPDKFGPMPQIRAAVIRLTDALVQHTLDYGLVDAQELHEQLTDELRGDIAELYDDKGELLPPKDWPMWARQGGVEVIDAPNIVHSSDGENSSWDVSGRKITVRMSPRHKSRELAAKLRAVNALVEAKTANETHVHIHAEIVEKLQGALGRKAKLIEARNVTPTDANEINT